MKRSITQRKLYVIILLFFVYSSCNKNERLTTPNPGQPPSAAMLQKNKTDFAKTLAQAVADPMIRDFLKNEAIAKFDADNDVLYPMVRDKVLPNGQSFRTYLDAIIQKDRSATPLKEIEANLPLLTILVPALDNFSAESWQTESQTPLVAVRVERDIKKNKKLLAYDNNGSAVELDYFKDPGRPILVIKDNEALEVRARGRQVSIAGEPFIHKQPLAPVFEDGDRVYFFYDENLYHRGSLSATADPISIITDATTPHVVQPTGAMGCSRWTSWSRFDPLVTSAFDKSIYNPNCPENVATVRDFVYYGIDPTTGTNTGPLKYNYRENITSIRCESLLTRSRFDDITEGNILDFDITIYTADSDPIFPLKKRLSVDKSKFFVTDASNPSPQPIDLTFNSLGLSPLELAVWNFKRQGDVWKFAIFEYDPGVTLTESRSIESNIGANFSIGDEKQGGKFGLTASVKVTKTVTLTYTDVSDDLGEAVSYWCDPVIKEKWPLNDNNVCGRGFGTIYRPGRENAGRSYDIGTGVIAITVEPRIQH